MRGASQRILLLLREDGLEAWARRGSVLVLMDSFQVHDPDALERFGRFADANRGVPALAMADLAEEDFQCATVPHVRGRERAAMVTRNLQRLYRATPYRRCDVLGREAEGRRDDVVLYSAIIRPELADPWLKAAARHLLPLCGLYSPAHLAGSVAGRLAPDAVHVLLVCKQKSGLRQILLHNGQLRFSRLAVARDPDPLVQARVLATEIERVRSYLLNDRMLARESLLEVLILADSPVLGALDELPGSESLRYTLIEPESAYAAAGLGPIEGVACADVLFLDALGQAAPGGYPLAPCDLRNWNLLRARRAMFAAGAMIGLAGTLAASGEVIERDLLQKEAVPLVALVSSLDAQMQAVRAAIPETRVPPEVMRSVVEIQQRVERNAPSVEGMLVALARALDRFPMVELKRLEWRAWVPESGGNDVDLVFSGPPPDGSGAPAWFGLEAPVESVLRIEARVSGQDADLRRSVSTVRAFADLLATGSGVSVLRLEEPLELASARSLRIEHTAHPAERGRFAIVIRHVPEVVQ